MTSPTHTPLKATTKQFRVATLFPGPLDSAISCSLRVDRFNSPSLQYEALSYEWGSSQDTTHSILLNDQSFLIRHNLWQALRALRSETEERVLWVDAICINQEDVLERNHQVEMMGDIYRLANEVLIWLGDDE
ncbi:HET-domain-containing protein, partial [Acephala macrosclerotiorum]